MRRKPRLNYDTISKGEFLRKYRSVTESRDRSHMIATLADLTGADRKMVVSELIDLGIRTDELPGVVVRYLDEDQLAKLADNDKPKEKEHVMIADQYAKVPDCRKSDRSIFEDMPLKHDDKYDVINDKITLVDASTEPGQDAAPKEPEPADEYCGLPFTDPGEGLPARPDLPEIVQDAIKQKIDCCDLEIIEIKADLIEAEEEMQELKDRIESIAGQIRVLEDNKRILQRYL